MNNKSNGKSRMSRIGLTNGRLPESPASLSGSSTGWFMRTTGTGFAVGITGGVASAIFHLFHATNFAAPLNNWTRLLTNPFDNNGNFNFTNPINPNSPQSFYQLQLP
jgi:hypothetical protein